jgi:stage II sporulation protein D
MRLIIALAALLVMLAAPAWAEGVGAADEDIQPDGIQPMNQPLIVQTPSAPAAKPPQFTTPVRVLLSSRAGQLEIDSEGAINVWDGGQYLGALIPPVTVLLLGEGVKARDAAGGLTGTSLTLAPKGGALLGFKGREYRGCFRATRAMQGGVLLLNVLDLEDYLRGVVPSEMPAMWNPEAVKAQAVAARTYALRRTIENRSAQYDVTADTNDQMYLGASKEHSASDAAISATSGMVIAYNGQPITAYYHSCAGGKTRNGTEPYLVCVDSPEKSPYDTWTLEYKLDELSSLLAKSGQGVGKLQDARIVPAPEERDGFRVAFSGDGGSRQLTTIKVRKVLGITVCKSLNFSVETLSEVADSLAPLDGSEKAQVRGAQTQGWVKIGSSYAIGADGVQKLPGAFVLARQPKPEKVRIIGHGYGHGLGMSQYGAKFMAEQGATWQEIILHYYSGVQIVSLKQLSPAG